MSEPSMNSFFTYLQSEHTAQQFLLQCYEKGGIGNAKEKSYMNCHAFIYYLEHGNKFFESSKQLTTVVQPVLLFYGLVHLLKAVIITKRPDYPETTKVLAHGVSSRKRKKKHYTFLNDEVTIHHNGLFPYFSEHLFSIRSLTMRKIKMECLLSFIPEMNDLFNLYNEKRMVDIGTIGSDVLCFPLHLLDTYYLTPKSFLHRLEPHLPNIKVVNKKESMIQVTLTEPLTRSFGPFFFNTTDDKIYFPIRRENFLSISEVMVHYLLLYNLSMLCRYETEWWGNLIHTKPDLDFPFIKHFLHYTTEKAPILLMQEIYGTYLALNRG